jgi:hypothetical protein
MMESIDGFGPGLQHSITSKMGDDCLNMYVNMLDHF